MALVVSDRLTNHAGAELGVREDHRTSDRHLGIGDTKVQLLFPVAPDGIGRLSPDQRNDQVLLQHEKEDSMPTITPVLEGRRIIITGGASGMGAGLVAAFPRLGAKVFSLDLDERVGTEVAANAQALGFCPVDVSKAESVSTAVGLAVERLQGLDVLVHAAAIAPGAPAEETSPELWSRVMAVNAMGTMLVNKAVFPHLKDRGGA